MRRGDDLAGIIVGALAASGETLRDDDVLVLAQKIVSKAQGRLVRAQHGLSFGRAERLAREVNKDARLVELILRELTEVVRHRRDVLIVAHRLGLVMANAGIDQSNVSRAAKTTRRCCCPRIRTAPAPNCARRCARAPAQR